MDSAGNLRSVPVNKNTVEYIAAQFRNNPGSLRFTDTDGDVLTGTDRVGTGAVIELMDGNTVLDHMLVIITGDVDGDGKITAQDVSHVSRFVADLELFNIRQLTAADVNGDGKLNNRDASYLSRYLVGKETL